MALGKHSHPSGHRVHSHSRWKYTLAAEKSAASYRAGFKSDDDEPVKVPVTLPHISIQHLIEESS
jgi:hypothetical protein